MKNTDKKKPTKYKYLKQLLDRSILLDESESPPFLWGILIFLCAVVVLFIIWASLVRIEEVETAVGEVVSSEEVVKIQHPIGGVITELLVKEGSIVKSGDVLMRLDSRDTDAVREQALSKLLSLYAQNERLSAILEKRNPDYSKTAPEASVFVKDQTALYKTYTDKYQQLKKTWANQIKQLDLQIVQLKEQQDSINRQIDLAEQDSELANTMYNKGSLSKSDLLSKMRTLESLREKEIILESSILKTEQTKQELDDSFRNQEITMISGVQDEYAGVNEQIAYYEAQVKRGSLVSDRHEVVTPTDGVVHGLLYTAAGMVVSPGATMMEILPAGLNNKVLARIDPKSIASVSYGTAARLKISAYPSDQYGAFIGKLTELSVSTFKTAGGYTYYSGMITIESRELIDGEQLLLLPGMVVDVEFITGKKTLMQYLLKPIFSSAREAFHEK